MRKITLTFSALLSVLVLSCNKPEAPVDPEKPGTEEPGTNPEPEPEPEPTNSLLVVVGQEAVADKGIYDAVVWVDGKRFSFTDGEHDSFCNAVCTYKDSVFIAGTEAVGELIDDGYYDPYNANNGVVYSFRIGEEAKFRRVVHSDVVGNSTASGIAYSNGHVYTSGFDSPGFDRRALYWADGKKHELTDGSTDALAYCIAADGDDVYVGGYIQSKDFKKEGAAVIWKNGVAQKLTDVGVLAKVNRIVIENGHVYAAGAYRDQIKETSWQGAMWVDGELTLFTAPAGVEIGGLYVKDGKWTVNGQMTMSDKRITACNWHSDGSVEELTPKGELCQGLGIAVNGDDTYTLTSEYFLDYTTYEEYTKGHLWKNGEEVKLELGNSNDYTFWGLAVARY